MFTRKSTPQPASAFQAMDMIFNLGMATAAWEAGDIKSLLDMFSDDVVWTHNAAHPDVPFYGTFKGKKEFEKWIDEFSPKNIAMQEIVFAEHNISSDNTVSRSGFSKYIVNKTNVTVELIFRHRFTFDSAGKIKTGDIYEDTNAVVKAFTGKESVEVAKRIMWPANMACEGDYVAQLGKVSQMWKTGNMAALEANVADDWEGFIGTVDNTSGVPFMGSFKGKDGFRKFIEGFSSMTIEHVNFHEHAVDGHNGIITRLAEFSFIVNTTNKKVDTQFSERFCFDTNGKMKWMQIVTDSEKIMSAYRAN